MRGLTRIVAQVYTGTAVRAFDRRAIDDFGIPGIRLMHRAGAAAFAALRERWPEARRLSIVCGAGNNAGDGYVVAGLARDAGLDVQLLQVGDPCKVKGEALAAKRFAECRLGAISQARDWDIQGDVVVDALLGTGLRGDVRETFRQAIEHINASGKPVLALDVPSGVDADSGGLLAFEPVRADLTVTFVACKAGLATGPGLDYAGDVLTAPLGVPEAVFDDQPGLAVANGAGLRLLQRRRNAHKGDFGRLLIVGGEADMGGAVLLAGEAALRTGAGTATVATRGVNRAAVLARRPELMVRAAETAADVEDLASGADAIAVGPGLGRNEWGEWLLDACLAAGKPLAIDADGLNIVAKRGGLRDLPAGTVVTPHPGEAGRLLGKDAAWMQSHRLEAAAMLSEHGAVAVLKGAGTLLAWAGAAQGICMAGNPAMATAGSGDVLTGIVGALLGRGLAPRAAAELGVWLHARAGDEANARCRAALLASDIVQAIDLAP